VTRPNIKTLLKKKFATNQLKNKEKSIQIGGITKANKRRNQGLEQLQQEEGSQLQPRLLRSSLFYPRSNQELQVSITWQVHKQNHF